MPKYIDTKMVDIWFQDEARVGQQGRTTRVWAIKGTRPRAVKQLQFISTYIFGAVCPSKGLSAALIMPYVGVITMEKHLEEISKNVSPGRHAVVIVDQASWHMAKSLNIPKNISLLPLPAYSPELNPCEQIWQFLRDRYLSNRCFNGYDDIVEACVYAWNQFISLPGKIKSMCSRSWATC